MKSHARAGFSLVELLISVSLMASVAGVTVLMSNASGSLANQSQLSGRLDRQLHGTLDRIVKGLRLATLSSLVPTSAAGSPSLTFQSPVGFSGGAVVLGPAQVFRLESRPTDLRDGIDNNGNGLVDEGRVVWLQDASQSTPGVVFCQSVAALLDGETLNGADDNGNGLTDEPGLSFDLNGRVLTIRMTVQGVDERGAVISRSREARVSLRNP